MNLRLQELVVDSSTEARTLTVQTTILWKTILGVCAIVGLGFGAARGPVVLGFALGFVLLVLLMVSFTNTLIIDTAAERLVLWSGIGPLRGSSTIPFDTITLVTIGDGGAGALGGGPGGPARPTYSLAVEVKGKKQMKDLISGVSAQEMVHEAHVLAELCDKPVFISSAMKKYELS